jgi:hypothetical protein
MYDQPAKSFSSYFISNGIFHLSQQLSALLSSTAQTGLKQKHWSDKEKSA